LSKIPESNTVWKPGELDREQVRVVCVFAVAGVIGVVRYLHMGETFAMSILSFGVVNFLDVLIAFWIGYLILIVFALVVVRLLAAHVMVYSCPGCKSWFDSSLRALAAPV
jgi:hypothetical protein